MSEITTDSVAAELEDILQSVEGLSSGDAGEANKNLGRLFRTVQKLNYLMQIQMAARSSSSNEKPLDGRQ